MVSSFGFLDSAVLFGLVGSLELVGFVGCLDYTVVWTVSRDSIDPFNLVGSVS